LRSAAVLPLCNHSLLLIAGLKRCIGMGGGMFLHPRLQIAVKVRGPAGQQPRWMGMAQIV
jgi:hypothetical protein